MAVQTIPWRIVLSALRDAVLQSETVDVLLRKALAIINAAYHVDGILWVGFDESAPEACRAYGTAQSWMTFGGNAGNHGWKRSDRLDDLHDSQSPDTCSEPFSSGGSAEVPSATGATESSGSGLHSPHLIRRFRPSSIPIWLLKQRESPQPMELETGDLIVPVFDCPPLPLDEYVTEGMDRTGGGDRPSPLDGDVRFVFQFRRSASEAKWTVDDRMGLQSLGHQLILACDALAFKRRLEQSQRHASLLSRTAHVLNTSIHPDQAIKQILAEMGQSMRSDRIILFDLRNQSTEILHIWERPRQILSPISSDGLNYCLWQDTVDLFLQGGASYVEFRLTNPDFDPLQDWFRASGIGSALILPIFIREEFLGAIALLSHRHDRSYLLDELQMARQNTDQLSIALAMIQYSRTLALTRDPASAQVSTLSQPLLTDEMTQLPNREALEKELENLSMASVWAFRAPFSIIVCDIDYFKLLNDTHGHDIGDQVLQRIAQRLQLQLRRGTPIYRYGGEEFAIILDETELQSAKDVAERLRLSIRSMPLRTTSEVLTITVSFGVAQLMPERDRHASDVLKRAERALSEAKRQGRDRVSMRHAFS